MISTELSENKTKKKLMELVNATCFKKIETFENLTARKKVQISPSSVLILCSFRGNYIASDRRKRGVKWDLEKGKWLRETEPGIVIIESSGSLLVAFGANFGVLVRH